MEITDVKEMQIKKLEKELAKNRNEQDRIRLGLGMDTLDEWLFNKGTTRTEEEEEEEALLLFTTPEGEELRGLEAKETKLMDQIIFLETGKDPMERRYEVAAELMKKYDGENAEPWHPRR